MSTEILAPPTNIEELVGQILMARQISRTQQLFLKCLLVYQNTLNEQEHILIERVFYGVRHGLLTVIE